MESFHQADAPFVVLDFLQRYSTDAARGDVRPLAKYQAIYVGYEDVVRAEYARLSGTTQSSGDSVRRFGRYLLHEEIGRGGQGVVFAATDTRLGRAVALKCLRGLGAWVRPNLERFRREAVAASRLSHPGICPVYDSGSINGIPFLAMQLLAGETLAKRLSRPTRSTKAPRSDLAATLAMFHELALALDYAHERGVIHRDIKPANIMITPSGRPIIMDFGMAHDTASGSSAITLTGELVGTPAYLPPERISYGTTDARSDVYSLAATLFESLSLRLPFEAPTRDLLLLSILNDEPTDLRRFAPFASRDLSRVLRRALDKDPDRRPASAAEFANDLAALIKGAPVRLVPVPATTRLVRWGRRHPTRLAIGIGLGACIAIAATLAGGFANNQAAIRIGLEHVRQVELRGVVGSAFAALSADAPAEARQHFEEALVTAPQNVEFIVGAASACCLAGDADAALAHLDAAASQHPILGAVRADVLRWSGKTAQAAAIERDLPPLSSASDLFLSVAIQRFLRPATSADPVRDRDNMLRAVLQDREGPRLVYYTELALACLRAGDRDLGARTAAAVVQIWPDNANAWLARAFALGHDDDAIIDACRTATRIDPTCHFAYASLAAALLRKPDFVSWQHAMSAMQRAVALRPDRSYYWSMLAEAHCCVATDIDGLASALALVDHAEQIAPTSTWSRRTRTRVELALAAAINERHDAK